MVSVVYQLKTGDKPSEIIEQYKPMIGIDDKLSNEIDSNTQQ